MLLKNTSLYVKDTTQDSRSGRSCWPTGPVSCTSCTSCTSWA